MNHEPLPQTALGDANRAPRVNPLDIVQVLESTQYLPVDPVTWAQGDGTGDGLFDQLDIMAAWRTGKNLHGPHVALAVDVALSRSE